METYRVNFATSEGGHDFEIVHAYNDTHVLQRVDQLLKVHRSVEVWQGNRKVSGLDGAAE